MRKFQVAFVGIGLCEMLIASVFSEPIAVYVAIFGSINFVVVITLTFIENFKNRNSEPSELGIHQRYDPHTRNTVKIDEIKDHLSYLFDGVKCECGHTGYNFTYHMWGETTSPRRVEVFYACSACHKPSVANRIFIPPNTEVIKILTERVLKIRDSKVCEVKPSPVEIIPKNRLVIL